MRVIGRLFLLLIAVLALTGGYIYYSLGRPYAPRSGEIFVDVPKGAGTRTIARLLTKAGVVPSEWQFRAARILRPGAVLQAGEYQFSEPESVWQVIDRLRRGDVYYVELRVPEGSNIFDIAAAVADTKLISNKDFLAIAGSPALIHDLDPQAPSLEGYLFPATYRLNRKSTAKSLAKEMTDRFRRAWSEAKTQSGRQGVDVHDTVTMASLIEKESAVPAERPQVASVYMNRLHLGMTLDCDPTTIYAAMLEDRYRGVIHRSDLESTNRYNTYRHAGLPPGPIANPGTGALKAALSPAQTDFLYFVARPDHSGGHHFSKSLEEHNKAVAEYRKGVKTGL